MKITNKHGLPESFVRFSEDNYKPKKNIIRVTELINPPQIRILSRDNWDKIEEDVSDNIWKLLGVSVHYILENYTDKKEFSEEKLEAKFGKWTLRGRPDLLSKEGTLSDYKVTSVWSYIYGGKPEWEKQLNVYRWMYAQYPKLYPQIKNLEIVAIFRDWVQNKTFNPDYPKVACKRISIPLWTDRFAENYIRERLELHSRAESSMPECNEEERWQRETTFAVKKEGAIKALRVLDSRDQALQFIADKKDEGGKLSIEERKGESVRCESYCSVQQFCSQYKEMHKADKPNVLEGV